MVSWLINDSNWHEQVIPASLQGMTAMDFLGISLVSE
jgi:hypothetical protein